MANEAQLPQAYHLLSRYHYSRPLSDTHGQTIIIDYMLTVCFMLIYQGYRQCGRRNIAGRYGKPRNALSFSPLAGDLIVEPLDAVQCIFQLNMRRS